MRGRAWLLQSDWLVRVERRVDGKLLLRRSRPPVQSSVPRQGTSLPSAALGHTAAPVSLERPPSPRQRRQGAKDSTFTHGRLEGLEDRDSPVFRVCDGVNDGVVDSR